MNPSHRLTTEPRSPMTAEAAFVAMRERIEAVSDDDLVPINLDIPRAVTIALGAAERIDQLAAELFALEGFDHRAVLDLRLLALATLYAHLLASVRASDGGAFQALASESMDLRTELYLAAETLSRRGVLPPERVEALQRGRSHLEVANDLIALSALFRDAWAHVENKTTVTLEEISRASSLGSALHAALGARRLRPRTDQTKARLHRNRAFTLFIRAYDECRRGVRYLRWYQGDAAVYVPSLRRTASTGKKAPVVEPKPAANAGSGRETEPLQIVDDVA
ncbi:MAG: hypothetical protein KDK70_02775 [Myxococcales bacterium]|nr:hypothetical protein [Myxococcales bacterium]